MSAKDLGKLLHRSEAAIELKRFRMGIACYHDSTDNLTINQVCAIMGVEHRKVRRWEQHGLPIRNVGVYMCAISQEDLIKFLKRHPDQWDAGKVRDDTLFGRFKWYVEKYEADKKTTKKRYYWTEVEEARLKMLYQMGWDKYKISKAVGKNPNAVRCKIRHMIEIGRLAEIKADKEYPK